MPAQRSSRDHAPSPRSNVPPNSLPSLLTSGAGTRPLRAPRRASHRPLEAPASTSSAALTASRPSSSRQRTRPPGTTRSRCARLRTDDNTRRSARPAQPSRRAGPHRPPLTRRNRPARSRTSGRGRPSPCVSPGPPAGGPGGPDAGEPAGPRHPSRRNATVPRPGSRTHPGDLRAGAASSIAVLGRRILGCPAQTSPCRKCVVMTCWWDCADARMSIGAFAAP
jgi:hypothetical protein